MNSIFMSVMIVGLFNLSRTWAGEVTNTAKSTSKPPANKTTLTPAKNSSHTVKTTLSPIIIKMDKLSKKLSDVGANITNTMLGNSANLTKGLSEIGQEITHSLNDTTTWLFGAKDDLKHHQSFENHTKSMKEDLRIHSDTTKDQLDKIQAQMGNMSTSQGKGANGGGRSSTAPSILLAIPFIVMAISPFM